MNCENDTIILLLGFTGLATLIYNVYNLETTRPEIYIYIYKLSLQMNKYIIIIIIIIIINYYNLLL